MKKVSLAELFNDAPYFRAFEGLVGAKYHIKDPDDINAVGLWFAKVPERMEIAKQVRSNYKTDSRDAARSDYEFSTIDVQPGDAIYDYHIHFIGARDGVVEHEDIFENFRRSSAAAHRNGAVVRFHIPKDIFHAHYELDEVKQWYRQRPYQIKFIDENLMVEMPDGSVEQLSANCDATLRFGEFSFERVSPYSGFTETLICGQPVQFYGREYLQYRGPLRPTDNAFDDLVKEMPFLNGDTAMGYMGISYGRAGDKIANPYASKLALFATLKNAFNIAGMVLSPEQKGDLDRHLRDTAKRYAYFEAHPVIM